MTFPLMGLFSHTPYLFIVLLIFRSHVSSDDYPLSFSSDSSSVHTLSQGYARTYCCPTRGIVLGFSVVGMVGIKGVVGGSVGRRGEWGDRSYGVMGWK